MGRRKAFTSHLNAVTHFTLVKSSKASIDPHMRIFQELRRTQASRYLKYKPHYSGDNLGVF